ncbi:MAG TPA: diguanylate cyclase, partial [Acidimicrobiales bacterium]|nr:diguanylate cyclase [Acidimicrobiales bacterium]
LADVGVSGADSLLERLRQHWASEGRPTFSAGIAVVGGGKASEALRLADEALYRAKRQGRNRWTHAATADTQLKIVR